MIDQDVLEEIQYAVQEPPNSGASFLSDLWTIPEVIDYLNQRQRQFLKETAILFKRADLITIPNETRHALPAGFITMQHAAFRTADTFYELRRGDFWEADHGDPNWETVAADRPKLYLEGEMPTLTLGTSPPTATAGVIEVLYVGLTTLLSNTGISFEVPDEFVPAIMWGVLSDMLSKEGRGRDLLRAGVAEARYIEGREAAKIMVEGWI